MREFLGYHGLDASTPRATLQNYLPGSLVLKSWPKRMRSSLGAAAGTGCVRRLSLDRPYADKQNGDEWWGKKARSLTWHETRRTHGFLK